MYITDFMRNNSNWEELLSNSPYCLKIKRKDNLILFNYSQIDSDPSNEIVKEARGLIIEDKTYKPVCYGFNRFYNIDETNAACIDWDTAIATSKEDGTLFFAYYYNGWHIKTRSTFDAEGAPLNEGGLSNFRELFDYLTSFYPNFSFDKLEKHYTYCFEGCSRYNRIVIDYENPKLYLLAMRNMNTLEEVAYDVLPMYGSMLNVDLPKYYYMNDEQGFRNVVEKMGEGHEGIVVRDAGNNRVKIKTLSYLKLHRLKNNGIITIKKIIEMIQINEQNEFLSYFPELTESFKMVENQLKNVEHKVKQIQSTVELWKNLNKEKSKKDFVQEFKTCELSFLYFAAFDNKLNSVIKNMPIKIFINYFQITL